MFQTMAVQQVLWRVQESWLWQYIAGTGFCRAVVAGIEEGWEFPGNWVTLGQRETRWLNWVYAGAKRVTVLWCRLLRRVWVSVFHVQQVYGGPEEGGWWYDSGELLETVRIWPWQRHRVVANLLRVKYADRDDPAHEYTSVASRGKVWTLITTVPGEDFPVEQPHYE